MLGDVQHEHTAGGRRTEKRLGHPIHTSVREAAHLCEIDFGIAHFLVTGNAAVSIP